MEAALESVQEIILLVVVICYWRQLLQKKVSNKFVAAVFALMLLFTVLGIFLGIQYTFLSAIPVFVYRRKHGRRKTMLYVGHIIMAFLCAVLILQSMGMVCMYCFSMSHEKIFREPSVFSFGFQICFFIIASACGYFVHKFLSRYYSPINDSYPKEIVIMVYLCLAMTQIAYLVNTRLGEEIGYPTKAIAFNFIFIGIYTIATLVTVFLVIRVFTKRAKREFELEQYNRLLEYTETIEKMNVQMSMFKHDYINIMGTMTAYLEEKDYDGLKKFFEDQIEPMNGQLMQKDQKIKLLRNIKIPALKGLISSKLNYALGLGIEVEVEVFEPIEEVGMELIELARILGIYLDNASEAAIEAAEPKIGFSMVKLEQAVAILVSNTFVDHKIPISKMQEQSFSTKGEGRGLGLSNVEQLLSGYPYISKETRIEKDVFIQHLVIPNQAKKK